MAKLIAIAGWLLGLVLTFNLAASAGEILDRIVASVNGHVVLQSDWEDAIRYEAFIAGTQSNEMPGSERNAVLDRLIDQELLSEQMHASDFQRATDAEINKRIQEVQKLYPDASTDAGWRATLNRYGLTENELRERVALQLNLMRLVDAHLRPNVNIDGKSIESYYNQELLPQLRQSGAKDVALADVTGKIKELLTEQKVNQLLISWLQNLRSSSDIRTMLGTPDPGNQLR